MPAENRINTNPGAPQCTVISCREVTYEKPWPAMQQRIHYTDWQMTGLLKSGDKLRCVLFPSRNHKLSAQLFAFPAKRLWHDIERNIAAGMLPMFIKITATTLSSSLICDCLFTDTFCSACVRIHSHVWSDQVKAPDLKHRQLQLLTISHCEKQLNDLIKII